MSAYNSVHTAGFLSHIIVADIIIIKGYLPESLPKYERGS